MSPDVSDSEKLLHIVLDSGFLYAPVALSTILLVKEKTRPKTTAWVRATVMAEPPGGKRRRTPGVRTKNSTTEYKNRAYIFVSNARKFLLKMFFSSQKKMGQCVSQPAFTAERTHETAPPLRMTVVNIADCQYVRPSKKDMAVCFVFFNPAKSKKMMMNYLYTIEKLKLASIPFFTLELIFNGRAAEISDAFHVRGTSILFHKEQLCKIFESRIPYKYTKLAFLDADIVFDTPTWYSDVSALLDTHEIVQPFSSAVWLDPTLKICMQERYSIVYMNRSKSYDSSYHPGFAWCFQRKWFKTQGFYTKAITGSGDTLSAAAWIGVPLSKASVLPALDSSYRAYCRRPLPKITCSDGRVFHMWHGSRENRQYVKRHEILNGITEINDILQENADGVLELSNSEVDQKLQNYFIQREDDGI
jgi:hypothetical protein